MRETCIQPTALLLRGAPEERRSMLAGRADKKIAAAKRNANIRHLKRAKVGHTAFLVGCAVVACLQQAPKGLWMPHYFLCEKKLNMDYVTGSYLLTPSDYPFTYEERANFDFTYLIANTLWYLLIRLWGWARCGCFLWKSYQTSRFVPSDSQTSNINSSSRCVCGSLVDCGSR